jgi:hypothetical protein
MPDTSGSDLGGRIDVICPLGLVARAAGLITADGGDLTITDSTVMGSSIILRLIQADTKISSNLDIQGSSAPAQSDLRDLVDGTLIALHQTGPQLAIVYIDTHGQIGHLVLQVSATPAFKVSAKVSAGS